MCLYLAEFCLFPCQNVLHLNGIPLLVTLIVQSVTMEVYVMIRLVCAYVLLDLVEQIVIHVSIYRFELLFNNGKCTAAKITENFDAFIN